MAPRRKKDAATTVAVQEKIEQANDDVEPAVEPKKEKRTAAKKNAKLEKEVEIEEVNGNSPEEVTPQRSTRGKTNRRAPKEVETSEPVVEESIEPAVKKPRGRKAQPEQNGTNDNAENDKQVANNMVIAYDVSTKKRNKKDTKKVDAPVDDDEEIEEKPKKGKKLKNESKAQPKPTVSKSKKQQDVENAEEPAVETKKRSRAEAKPNQEIEPVDEPAPVKRGRKRAGDKLVEPPVEENVSKKNVKKADSASKEKKSTKSRKGEAAEPVEVASPKKQAKGKPATGENVEESNSPSKEKKSAKLRKGKTAEPVDVASLPKKQAKGKATPEKKATKPNKRNVPKEQKEDELSNEVAVDGGAEKSPVNSRKRAAPQVTLPGDGESAQPNEELITKRSKNEKANQSEPKPKMNATDTDYANIDFDSGKEHSLKICSWNVAGLRAVINKNGFEYFEHEKPDIICLQEIKCLEEEVPEAAKIPGYHPYWCSTPGGRGGVAILTKIMPYSVDNNIGDKEMDEEGRIITAEYSKFYLVNTYVPNAGRKLVNMDRRLRWNKMFDEHISELKKKKPVIIMGDMNVAHSEIDLANPKTNTKNAGFTKEERDGMTDLLSHGYVDVFRHLNPEREKAYTFWSYMGGNRAKNVGWRLDYAIVSENLVSKVVDCVIRDKVLGSDHCPIILLLNI